MSTAPAQPASPQPPPKKKRWVRKIFISLVIALSIVAILIQIVLWTDLPRNIVVSLIEKQLALRLTVKALHTNWLGHTELRDVTIALPLADKAFLEVAAMKVKNTSLFGLLLFQSVDVEKIELDHPHLYVWQNADGGWNLREVAELLARAGGKTTGEQSAQSSSMPVMPDVHLVDGTITIIDNKHRTLDLSPLSVEGFRDTAVSFAYDIQIPPQLSIKGKLVPGGNWAHEVEMKLHNLGPWTRPWKSDFPDVALDAKWRGEAAESDIHGRLELRQLSLGGKPGSPHLGINGALTAAFGNQLITIHPDNLVLQTSNKSLPRVKLASGALTFNQTTKDLKSDQLLVALFGGAAKVSGDYNLNTSAGRLDANWEKLLLPNGMTHDGAITATFSRPFPDRFFLDGHLNSSSQQQDIAWLGSLGFRLNGASLADFDWTVAVDTIRGRRHNQGLTLDGLKMTGGLHNQTLSLDTIGLANKDLLSGSARYHLNGEHGWEAYLIGQRWPFTLMPGTELAFELNAHGNDKAIRIDDLAVKSPDVRFDLTGAYVYQDPKPLDVKLSISNAPPTQAPAALASNTQSMLVNGSIESHIRLHGATQPLNLEVMGNIDARELDIRGHHLGDVNLVLSKQSHVDTNGAFIYTDSLSLLGGKWGIDSIFVFDTDLLKVDVDVEQLQLKQAAQFADQQDISGVMDGRLVLLVAGLNPDVNKMQITDSVFTIKNLNAGGLAVDQIDATVALDNGNLKIDPIRLKRGHGGGDVRIAMRLKDYRRIDLSANFAKWPVDVQGVPAHLDASVDVPTATIFLADPGSGYPDRRKLRINADQITYRGTTTVQGTPLDETVAYAGISGRVFDLRALHMQLLGGRLDGHAHADLDKLLSTTAEFTWEKLDFKQIALMIPQLHEFEGKISGHLRLAPATESHPLEPLAVVITTTFDKGLWRTLPIKDARVAAYLGGDEGESRGGWSIVLDDSPIDPSYIHLADGTVDLWARVSTHGRDSSSLAQLKFFGLNLNKLAHAIEPTAAEMPGQVAGSVLLIRAPVPVATAAPLGHAMFPGRPPIPISPVKASSPKDSPLKELIDPIYGEGKIELTKTNLAKFPPFAFLYDSAKLFQNVNLPEGHGTVDFRLERGGLRIESLRYFNRGAEIRAIASLTKLWDLPNDPFAGSAFLTARPLAGVRLPFVSDLDTTLTAIQHSIPLTGVKISGTLHKYKPVPVLLSEVGQEMKSLLVHDAKAGGE